MERSAGLRPAAARSAERAQEIPWVFGLLNVLRLTEPRSAAAEIDLGNTPLTPPPFFSLSSPTGGEGVVVGVKLRSPSQQVGYPCHLIFFGPLGIASAYSR